ncbi:FCD domain-containing protein [Acidocella aminolytica]|jgi:DNA-binding GntR family transcriptional regulator/transposase|uniref:Transcriptional regulator GntR n=1 Tax=Acidocella aminolytica 101 = DSM 11237 TaxID=1120923 RepID=A0A0D6PCW3_9PROT|nr:FCD domain-containing protein [Acidocella aminolytica]GAN79171.1 transcriptional regulator GntR [Acidocella aminolytica 101 = DSM 11237]SHE67513.1 DNA-binding transcriptional regulator, GntR family [Acidocella aminolytica 101 = DSM 11237]
MTRDDRLEWVKMFEQTGHAGLVCDRFGISRPTLRKWVLRYRQYGLDGLDEKSRRPTSSPNQKVFEREEALILELRRKQGLGVARLREELNSRHGLDLSIDTIAKVLRRAGEPAKRPLGSKKKPDAMALRTINHASWLGCQAPRPDGGSGAASNVASAAIAALISRGDFKPGQKLSEAVLMRKLLLSRAQVREGLKYLALGGVVRLERNRGAFVAMPSPDEVEQAYAARRLIEREIVESLSRHCTEEGIRKLRSHLDLQMEALKSGDRGQLVWLLTEFHRVLASLGDNRALEGFVQNLTDKTSLATLLYDLQEDPARGVKDHAALIDLLERGDAQGASALMQRHLSTNQRRLIEASAVVRGTAEPGD